MDDDRTWHEKGVAYHARIEAQWDAFLEQIQILLPDVEHPEDIAMDDLAALLRARYPDGLAGSVFVPGPSNLQ